MKVIFSLLLVAAFLVIAVPHARSLGTPPSPPGVAADNWISFSDSAGFVVIPGDLLPSRDKPLAGTVKGYFMVRQGKSWLRVDSAQEAEPRVLR
jgi:hypothetical protein